MSSSRYVTLCLALLMLPGRVDAQQATAVASQVLPFCSPAITNPSCAIVINRDDPSSPLTMKMRTGAKATLRVLKRPLDAIQMEVTTIDVARPDPAAAAFTAFLPAMLKVTFSTREVRTPSAKASIQGEGVVPANPYDALIDRLAAIQRRQEAARAELQAVDEVLQEAVRNAKIFQRRLATEWKDTEVGDALNALYLTLDDAAKRPHPGGAIAVLRLALDALTKEIATLPRPNPILDEVAQKQFDELIALLNAVTFNQGLLEGGLKALEAGRVSLQQAASIVRQIEPATALATEGTFTHSTTEVGRSVTVKIASQDMLSKTVSPLATVVMVWNDTKWEVSGGAVFSSLKNRTFQYAPHVIEGQPQLDSAGKVRSMVAETITRPTVVPFAFLHYRLLERPLNGRRVALLATGGLGINTASGSADFAYGASLSYRALVIGALFHQGRDLQLLNGVIPGSELAGNPTLATKRVWQRNKAIGVSLRVPF